MEPFTAADLVPDHRAIDGLFRRLGRLLDSRAARPALEVADLLWARLGVHIRAEHLVMFDALRRAVSAGGGPYPGELDQALGRLRADHDMFMVELAAAVNALKLHVNRKGDEALPEDLAAEVRGHVDRVARSLEGHNALEEQKVYAWLDQVLDSVRQHEVRSRMLRHLRNMPPRFRPTTTEDGGRAEGPES